MIKFVPAKLPPQKKPGYVYKEAVRDFLDTGYECARIQTDIEGREACANGLRTAISSLGLKDQLGVSIREKTVYLYMKDLHEAF